MFCSSLYQQVQEAVEDLRWCDSLVLVYPTWWSGMPAVLKGFFDRVFLPNVAFHLPQSSAGNMMILLALLTAPSWRRIGLVGIATS